MEKNGIRLKSDLVFMRNKIKRKENFQIYFETEHLPPSTMLPHSLLRKKIDWETNKTEVFNMFKRYIAGADPGEVKRVNFHPPFSELPCFFFFLIPQILIGSNTLLQKFTPHFKILDPRLYCNAYLPLL